MGPNQTIAVGPNQLDKPTRHLLRDTSVPLVVTEGTKKADALWGTHQIPTIALAGVYAWRGRDQVTNGLAALAAWEDICLKSPGSHRDVFVIFDSDVMVKAPVLEACRRLGALLVARGAAVWYVLLPAGPNGQKVGLDDFLVAGGCWSDLQTLAQPDLPAPRVDPTEPEEDFSDIPDESGAELLDDVTKYLSRFLAFRQEEQAWAMAMWIAHTWAIDSFPCTPRLALLSPTPRAGKTRALELVDSLAARPELLADVSSAYLFRSIPLLKPTFLVDECDALFSARANGDTKAEDVRAIINSGYRKGAFVGRIVGQGADMRPVRFPTFGPVALAGIGTLPATVLDRAIVIRLRRRAASESIEPFEVTDPPEESKQIQRRLALLESQVLKS